MEVHFAAFTPGPSNPRPPPPAPVGGVDRHASWRTPGYVKIAWTIRADDINAAASVFRTETRAIATDANARKKFRRYWSFFSPGSF
jgi:hypothetical protein